MLSLLQTEPLALIAIFHETIGRIELPGQAEPTTVSPVLAGWEGFGFRVATILPAEIPAGKRRVSLGADGVTFVDGEPTWILEDVPLPPRRMVPKSLVTQRVIDAGKIDQAMALLQMDWAKFARWVAPDQPAVYFDDPDTLAMLDVLELDPEGIMAPE